MNPFFCKCINVFKSACLYVCVSVANLHRLMYTKFVKLNNTKLRHTVSPFCLWLNKNAKKNI